MRWEQIHLPNRYFILFLKFARRGLPAELPSLAFGFNVSSRHEAVFMWIKIMYHGIHTPVIHLRPFMIQREAYRFPVKLPVTFSGQRDGTGVLYDVSVKGCRIVSRTPLSVGHALSLLI